jgi:hypothetical protein
MEDQAKNQQKVTPLTILLIGSGAFFSGAVIVGSAHFYGTAKQLSSEGISTSTRLQAFPIAAKALFLSTCLSLVVATGATAGWRLMGGEHVDSTELAHFSQFVKVAEEQRVCLYLSNVSLLSSYISLYTTVV